MTCPCRERAAKVCDAMWDELKGAGGTANTFGAGAVRGKAGAARELAKAIRALECDCVCVPSLSNAELAEAIAVAYRIGTPQHFHALQEAQLRRALLAAAAKEQT